MFSVVFEQFVTVPHSCTFAPTHATVGALRSIDTHGGAWQSTFTVCVFVSVPQSFVTVAVTTYDTFWPAVQVNGTCRVQFCVLPGWTDWLKACVSPTLTTIVAAFGPQFLTVPWIVTGLLLQEFVGPEAVSSTHG